MIQTKLKLQTRLNPNKVQTPKPANLDRSNPDKVRTPIPTKENKNDPNKVRTQARTSGLVVRAEDSGPRSRGLKS